MPSEEEKKDIKAENESVCCAWLKIQKKPTTKRKSNNKKRN